MIINKFTTSKLNRNIIEDIPLIFDHQKPVINQNILLIEDNVINQKIGIVLLNSLGFQYIDIASTGYQATTLITQKYYSLIFLDINLPDTNGFEVYKAIKKSCRNESTPIVVATSYREKQIRNRCLDIGVEAVITKPLDYNLLKNKLPLWLDRNNQHINHFLRNTKLNHINASSGDL
jgi:CheY-like chemotaxis protein